jgi:hypothetical protein
MSSLRSSFFDVVRQHVALEQARKIAAELKT